MPIFGDPCADAAFIVLLPGSFAETKLCSISVLHVLNSRGKLRHDWSGTERSTERGTSGNATTKGGARPGVSIFTETIVHRDASHLHLTSPRPSS